METIPGYFHIPWTIFHPFFLNIDAGKGWKLSPNTPASYFPWISMENPGQSTPGQFSAHKTHFY